MTVADYESTRVHSGESVEVNPLTMFVLLLVMPYLLFFGLLMLLTGQTDIVLLFDSVVRESQTVYMKAWIIGTFILSVLGALWVSGYRTTNFITQRITGSRKRRGGSVGEPVPMHYVFEETPHEEADPSESTPQRYARLDSVITDKDR